MTPLKTTDRYPCSGLTVLETMEEIYNFFYTEFPIFRKTKQFDPFVGFC